MAERQLKQVIARKELERRGFKKREKLEKGIHLDVWGTNASRPQQIQQFD
jgi:hypothetical protein